MTRMEKRIMRFKKEFGYVPSPTNPNFGTVTVDGIQYYVDMDLDSPTAVVPSPADKRGEPKFRQMEASLYGTERLIIISHEMFICPYKIGKAMFLHEAGHVKFHNPFLKDNECYVDVKYLIWDYLDEGGTAWFGYEDVEFSEADLDTSARNRAYNYARKFEHSSIKSHANASEYEADAFAANRVGVRNVIAAVVLANVKWLFAKGNLNVENVLDAWVDVTTRAKALCDSRMRNEVVYK